LAFCSTTRSEATGLLGAPPAQLGEAIQPVAHVGGDGTEIAAVVGAQPEVLLHGELGERAPALGDVGDAEPGHRVGALAAQGASVEGDAPRRADHAADGSQRGGLTGAVGAQHHRDLPLLDPQVQAPQDGDRAVAAAHVLELEQRGHAGAPR
jgi:hypothetical protein